MKSRFAFEPQKPCWIGFRRNESL